MDSNEIDQLQALMADRLFQEQVNREVATMQDAVDHAVDSMRGLLSGGGDILLQPLLAPILDRAVSFQAELFAKPRLSQYEQVLLLLKPEHLAATLYDAILSTAIITSGDLRPEFSVGVNKLRGALGRSVRLQARFNLVDGLRRGLKKPYDSLPIIKMAKADKTKHRNYVAQVRARVPNMLANFSNETVVQTGSAILDAFDSIIAEVMDKRFDKADVKVVHKYVVKPELQEAMEVTHLERKASSAALGFMIAPPLEVQANRLAVSNRYYSGLGTAHEIAFVPSQLSLDVANRIQAQPYSLNVQAYTWLTSFSPEVIDQIIKIKEVPTELAEGVEDTPKAQRQLKEQQHATTMSNRAKQEAFKTLIAGATDAGHYSTIYFPAYFDFRGRLYQVDHKGLGPQATKTAKALLLSGTEGQPLGAAGLDALYHELANALTFDKDVLSVKMAAAKELTPRFAGILADPMSDTVWLDDTEEPLKALVVMAEIQAALDSGNPETYKSRVFVYVDGTCNGMQHLSLLMQDEVGAKATNVIGTTDAREDFYLEVGKVFMDILEDDFSEAAMWWKDMAVIGTKMANGTKAPGIRKIVKRGCMTIPYGATDSGLGDQVIVDGFTSTAKRGDADTAAQAKCFQLTLLKAMAGAAPRAMAARAWLTSAVRAMVKAGDQPAWTIPTGSSVAHNYTKPAYKNVVLANGSQTKLPDFSSKTAGTPSADKNVNGIVANYIHSMDAAHLQLTVNSLEGLEVTAVHDSYGTLPGSIQVMSEAIRATAVQMYSTDPLARLAAELQDITEAELPEAPEQGTLDVNQTLNSPYFFS